ncbi:endonuclease/exonuclease/phosphatase family protein [Alphaproteobacteria bacterium KMM 3653]|uniref:Endonuclease/exonuclease/phosphatase family protein n=1 Tax=Harenicola maris TaxID=2841044 RepID=A0AAP2CLY5_9RHOB|nr:endonuclease/exonuclease/phosphatase family protein [Harenicola maris]
MRLATYNVEWFNSLFDLEGNLQPDGGWSARHDVTRAMQLEALGRVFGALDADAVMVVEAPDYGRLPEAPVGGRTAKALEAFAAANGLRARRALVGFANDTQQELALMYDPDVVDVSHAPMGEETGKKGSFDAPRFDGTFRIDLDIDAQSDLVKFSKPPLEVALTSRASGAVARLIGVHIKSKAPHGARNDHDVMRISIANRRKQLAQAIWLRQRVEQHLDAGDPLIVMGDFNDGPGLDEYEALFGRSAVEIVLGADEAAERRLFDPHAQRALGGRFHAREVTARFYQTREKRFLSALLDYVMVTPDLRAMAPQWRIWHPFDDPACYGDAGLREALLTASDHFPVTLDIDL